MRKETENLSVPEILADEEPITSSDKALLVLPDDYYLDDEVETPVKWQAGETAVIG